MIRTYIILVFISLLTLLAVVYGFTQVGTPGFRRKLELDRERISSLRSIKSAIQAYYSKNKILPKTLDDLLKDSRYLKEQIQDPETNGQYEYSIVDQTSYKLCATFGTDSEDEKNKRGGLSYSYEDEEFKHSKGNRCFDLKVTVYNANLYSVSPSPVPKTTTILDQNIQEVTTDAKNISAKSNFPYGLFSSNLGEHGLYNESFDPIVVTIKFRKPTKIKSILSTFGSCNYYDCTKWSVTGVNSTGGSEELIKETAATGRFGEQSNNINSPILVISESEFSSIKITANPKVSSHSQHLFWEKIKIEYK